MSEDKLGNRLRYEAELSPLKDFIQQNYHESTETVFRNTLATPPTENDSLPQSKRYIDTRGEELEFELTEEDAAEMTPKDKKEYVSERALSVFVSMDKCKANVANITRHIFRKYSKEEAEVYLRDKRGVYIVEMALHTDAGLIERSADKKGHKNLLLYEGVTIDELITNTYGPFELKDFIGSNDGDGKENANGSK